jgi:hypothetical protein
MKHFFLNVSISTTCASLICAAMLYAAGCGRCSGKPNDDETRIRKIIEEAAALAEKHDINGLMKLATKNFTAEPGQKDRQAVRGILFIAFRKYGKFSVKFPRPSVEVAPGGLSAKADTPFLIVRQGSGVPDLSELYDDPKGWTEKVGKIADLYNIELWFDKVGDEWLVHEAKLMGLRNIYDI